VGAFIRELLRTDIYKRSQGRITRQVTFAAIVLAIALGLLRLSELGKRWDPSVNEEPAKIALRADSNPLGAAGTLTLRGPTAKEATIELRKGETLADVAAQIEKIEKEKKIGVTADAPKDKDQLELASTTKGSSASLKIVQLEPPKLLQPVGALEVKGRDEVNLGLHYWVPGLLLLLGAWASYRLVNFPVFADFLIAVEAEMNKVSWPTRSELFRASTVVLILIFSLAIILGAYDLVWGVFIRRILGIGA
jgi:preprotein translocase SecE subunit